MPHFIKGKWLEGNGKKFHSLNPATQEIIWEGHAASETDVEAAFAAAKNALPDWRRLSLEERISYLIKFQELIKNDQDHIAEAISKETGKPLWEALTEVQAMIGKIPISIEAYHDRCKTREETTPRGLLVTRHKPHGVVAVLGPFNFPGHLPHGHIIPALLAGNTIVFKSSEFTPQVSEVLFHCWEKVGLPEGALNLLQGGKETGKQVASHLLLRGLFFTGSAPVGLSLLQQFASDPGKILALEMGGNNPLVFLDSSDHEKAAEIVIQSSYLTAGQRCSAARRLIVVQSKESEKFLKLLQEKIAALTVGPYTQRPEPFMGPVIHLESMERLLADQKKLLIAGATPLLEMQNLKKGTPFLSPGLIDVTQVERREDKECFGPLLQLIRVPSFEEAILEANRTAYGLTAGLISKNEKTFLTFFDEVLAGVINWNTQLTQASSRAPFGGLGKSGNHRPSAYLAADYTSYPVASMRSPP